MKKFTTIKKGVLISSTLLLGAVTVSAQMMEKGTETNANGGKQGHQGMMRGGRMERGESAREGSNAGGMGQGMRLGMNMGGVAGQVSSISGSVFTVMARAMGKTSTSTVPYTVDASRAVFMKNRATTTVSSLLVGDRVLVSGDATGTAVLAKYVTIIGTSTPMMNGDERGRGMMGNGGGMMRSESPAPSSPKAEEMGFFGKMKSFFGGFFGK